MPADGAAVGVVMVRFVDGPSSEVREQQLRLKNSAK
jgi:hypothetical protein